MKNDWSLTNLPPEGHEDVAEFAYMLFQDALEEQERVKQRDRNYDNHALYRGKFTTVTKKKKTFTPINLFFANVERTVSNITANNPKAEVVDMDGQKDEAEDIIGARLKMWWKETNQKHKLKDTANNQEIYGYTTEKPYWDVARKIPDGVVRDCFTILPAPGIWHDWATDIPYVVFLDVDYIDDIEQEYGIKGVSPEDVYDLLGESRENHRPKTQTLNTTEAASRNTFGKYSVPMSAVGGKKREGQPFKKGLIIEIWLRNAHKIVTVDEPMVDPDGMPIFDPETGFALFERKKVDKYPDGIRKITIAKKDLLRAGDNKPTSYLVLDDSSNPNINPKLDIEIAKTTYPWGRFPVIKADSYRDTQSSYGFSAGEQTADLLIKISNIFTRLFSYIIQCLTPFLVVERYCGITREMIANEIGKEGRLILMPTKPNADIRFIQVPNLPASFFQVLNILLQFYDRIYQIEDADRGKAPGGVTAASAIVALQERNGMLMQNKRESIEFIASERGRWAIGLWQNFGTREEFVDVNEEPQTFTGVKYAGRRFNYQIETGSTMPKTELQVEEQVKWLASMRLVSLRTILETLGFPNWKNIVEREGENQLDMALNILIQAGLKEEEAAQLKQFLIQPQGGPGDTAQNPKQTPAAGTPKAQQGQLA